MNNKSKTLTAKEIEEKKENLKQFINDNKENNFEEIIEKHSSQKETITDKLNVIKNELLVFKNKNISYSILSKILFETIGLKISEQSLRSYCQNQLNFPKKSKSKNKRSNSLKDIDIKKIEKNDSSNISNELEDNNIKFD